MQQDSPTVQVLDYRNAFATSTAAVDGVEVNTCRAQILATCTLSHDQTGQSDVFYLGKECIGEHMYKDIGIVQDPTAEVCIIFNETESSSLKKFANHERDLVQPLAVNVALETFAGLNACWTDLRFTLPQAEARPLPTPDQIIHATLDGQPLVGRTTLTDPANGWRAVLEYPIAYMNVHPPEQRFQVDLGPVLYPDFGSTKEKLIERLQLAYILFNQLDEVEFAIRVPTPVAEGQSATTLHYAHIVKMPAHCELFALAT